MVDTSQKERVDMLKANSNRTDTADGGAVMNNTFIKAAQLDAQIAIAHAGGYDLSPFPRWHARNKPTLRGAIELAIWSGIQIERKQVEQVKRPNGHIETRVILWVTGSPIGSAALSTHRDFGEIIATGLAFRNAVERVCFDQRKVWQGNERI